MIREDTGVAQRDHAAEGVRDDADRREFLLMDQLSQIVDVTGDRIIAVGRPLAVAVAAQSKAMFTAGLNARPPRARWRQAGVDDAKLFFALGSVDRAMSWTFDSVADAKWSATAFLQVASCLWHTLPAG